MVWISPFFLLVIFVLWVLQNVFGLSLQGGEAQTTSYIKDLFIEPNPVAWMSIAVIALVWGFGIVVVSASRRFKGIENIELEENS